MHAICTKLRVKNKLKRVHLENVKKQKSADGVLISDKSLSELQEEWDVGKEEVQARKEALSKDFEREGHRLEILDKAVVQLDTFYTGIKPEDKLNGALKHLREL